MNSTERLRYARNILLKLHKSLVDFERAEYEKFNGTVNSGQFLGLLIENESFSWLRKFSTLIVDIDEMFDLDDGFSDEMIDVHLEKMRELVDMREDDEFFRGRYKFALQSDPEAAGSQGQLKAILSD